jgi:hypothetical protein
LSSNGGLLLASKAEKAVGIVSAISNCIKDWRKSNLVLYMCQIVDCQLLING